MHPDQAAALAHERCGALMAAADQHRRSKLSVEAGAPATRARRRLRGRAGWWLVAIGLRIAVGRAGAHAYLQPATGAA